MNPQFPQQQIPPVSLPTSARLWLVLLAVYAVGCGGAAPEGPKRFALSGKVTYDGQPVPAGEIFFEPNNKKGNGGPATSAEIRAGAYSIPTDRGVVGGAMIVKVIGYDGKPPAGPEAQMNPHGMQMFKPYQADVDLPKSAGKHDITVPK